MKENKGIRYLMSCSLLLLSTCMMLSKPALREPRTYVQPDGTVIEIRMIGDEHLHFATTLDGTLIHRDADGFYRIGTIAEDGAVISTGIDIRDTEKVKVHGVRINTDDIEKIKNRRQQRGQARRSVAQSGMGRYSETFPIIGNTKALVILVEYSDVKFKSSYNAKSYFNNMINGDNFTEYKGTGSALEYFRDQSGGKFTPSFDVYGPVTLPNTQRYYGRNDRYGDDANAHLMVTDAIEILDSTVDFSQYDTDGDGYIDNVYIFYAGQGEADYGDEDTVWPHSWELFEAGIKKKADGVWINRYACSNEWEETTPDGVGTFVHEFSHVMGLPDLYHTTSYDADYTPDAYSVMDYGPYNNDGRTPPNYSAYEKNAMGWYEPMMINDAMSVTLRSIDSGDFGMIPTEKDNEFFLFENRQQTGWDTYIPNHGMLIWHIDYNKSVFENNEVNNTKNHQYVDIVEANNKPGFDYEDGYTFPGTTGKTTFTSSTTPAFKSWANKPLDYPITNIAEKDGIITFDVAGGTNNLATPEPTVAYYSEYERNFIVKWAAIEGATDYYLSVFAGTSDISGEIENGFDNSRLPSGWTASTTDWYTTNTNYGASSPSYKFSKDGQTLTTEETDGDVTKIEFWAKGQSSQNTYLTIEGLVDGAWTKIADYEPLTNKSETALIETGIPAGVRKVRFTMRKSTGNIAIDDIVLTYGGGSQVLADYDNISTGGETSYMVSGLPEGINEYYFTVTVTNGEKTRTSAPVYLLLEGESSTTDVTGIDANREVEIEYFNLQGIKITNPQKGSVVIRKQGKKITKIIF